MNILVVRVGNIGDVLMVTPLIKTLKRVFPDANIDLITSPQALCIIKQNPHLRDIFVYKKVKRLMGVLRRHWLAAKIIRRNYDLCFILEEQLQYKKFVAEATGTKCIKIGYKGEGESLLNLKVAFSYDKHIIENSFNLLKAYKEIEFIADDFLMDLVLPQEENVQQLDLSKGYVLLHPGVTENWPYRGWSPEGFGKIVKYLIGRKLNIIITGQTKQQELIGQILDYCSMEDRSHVTVVMNRPFNDLIHLVNQASLVLCSDTGVLHVARALKIPVLGLFGPSNPFHTGFIGEGKYRHIRNDFSCGPCNYSYLYRYQDKAQCMDGKMPLCMSSITIEQVKSQLEALLVDKK